MMPLLKNDVPNFTASFKHSCVAHLRALLSNEHDNFPGRPFLKNLPPVGGSGQLDAGDC